MNFADSTHEEREEASNKSAAEESTFNESIRHATRGAAAERLPATRRLAFHASPDLGFAPGYVFRVEDVYHNGLGTRLRC